MRILIGLIGLAALAGVGAAVGFYLAFVRDLPELRSIADYRPPLASHVSDRNGRSIGEFFVERRTLTPLEEIPEHVVMAFVASEDNTFFEHSGIDYMSILRAAWVNLAAGGEIRQGGSTITQQTVKTLLLTPERSYRRKIREMVLARDIERRFSKQEILYLYLNQIYFGHGAHGIGEAAHSYFAKTPAELTVSEAALLAGLPKAPSRYSPHNNPDQAEARRQYVLERMREDGFIDVATYREAITAPPELRDPPEQEDFAAAAYFVEEVRRTLFDALGGDAVLEGGLRIETTLDIDLQTAGVAAVKAGLLDLSHRQGYRGPERQVPADEIPAEVARIAEENGLAGGGEDEAEPPTPSGDGPFLGVVTEVDSKAELARVALAPDLVAEVHLESVSWARPPNPERLPYPMRSIRRILSVGDVAHFVPLPAGEGAEGPLQVTLHQDPIVQGALLAIDLPTQEVITMVGGYDFERSQFNRVTQARRQPGSAFKPLIYGAAIAHGYTPATIVHDRPVVYVDEESGFVWRPRNYKREFYGPITLRDALSRSVNNATVHLFRDVGVGFVIDYARRLGIESPLARDLSLALGSSGLSLLELTRAYGVFANQGRRVAPVFIRRVTDRDGNVVAENVELGNAVESPEADAEGEGAEEPGREVVDVAAAADAREHFEGDPDQVVPPEQAYLVADLLRAVVEDPDGTGWRLRDLKRPVGGKTGTTNDQADAWFLGFSPEIATGVWVGHDETRFLGRGETGSRAAAPIWVAYMREALAGRPVRDFQVPEAIVFARIDRKTGLLADATAQDTVFQSFLVDTVPTERASASRSASEGRRLLRLEDF